MRQASVGMEGLLYTAGPREGSSEMGRGEDVPKQLLHHCQQVCLWEAPTRERGQIPPLLGGQMCPYSGMEAKNTSLVARSFSTLLRVFSTKLDPIIFPVGPLPPPPHTH